MAYVTCSRGGYHASPACKNWEGSAPIETRNGWFNDPIVPKSCTKILACKSKFCIQLVKEACLQLGCNVADSVLRRLVPTPVSDRPSFDGVQIQGLSFIFLVAKQLLGKALTIAGLKPSSMPGTDNVSHIYQNTGSFPIFHTQRY